MTRVSKDLLHASYAWEETGRIRINKHTNNETNSDDDLFVFLSTLQIYFFLWCRFTTIIQDTLGVFSELLLVEATSQVAKKLPI